MVEYISTFTTGFSDLIPKALAKLLPGSRILKVYDGLVNYCYDGKEEDIEKVFLFNNSFLVIRKYQGGDCELNSMTKNIISIKRLPASSKTFRVRYSVNNQFVSIDKSFTRKIEENIFRLTKAKIDRVNPQTEYWFIKRSENIGFFCRLLNKRKHTEKDLNKGELRPELAYLICMLGELSKDSTVLDPFVGYGSIPKQIKKHFPYKKILASDLSSSRIEELERKFRKDKNVQVAVRDALDMQDIITSSIDAIITDPPWGYYEDIGDMELFYKNMLREFCRVLKDNGMIVILSARKSEFETASADLNLRLHKRIDTLVNGKKAAVYLLRKNSCSV